MGRKQISFKVEKDLLREMNEIVKRQGVSIQSVLEEFLKGYVKDIIVDGEDKCKARTVCWLPKDVAEKVKNTAKNEGTSLQHLAISFLKDYYMKHKDY